MAHNKTLRRGRGAPQTWEYPGLRRGVNPQVWDPGLRRGVTPQVWDPQVWS